LALSVLGIVPYVSHTWSIGTEEQFYLVWPVLIKYIKKYRIALMVFIIASYLLAGQFLTSSFGGIVPYNSYVNAFWSSFNIDCMAIGGIFAILLYHKHPLLKVLHNQFLFYLSIILVTTMIIKEVYIPIVNFETYAVLFGIIILNFASNPQIKISLEHKLLNYLGNISYGLYMYHPIGIVIALRICFASDVKSNLIVYPFIVLLTIVIAGLSYKYFESYFLKFKQKFSNIISGDSSQLN
jgi:peptidoglycan/LPS O-acetylase OafA/YrhL